MKFGGSARWPTRQREQAVTFRGDVLFCRDEGSVGGVLDCRARCIVVRGQSGRTTDYRGSAVFQA